ncbi:hypothetical protein BJ508DRAFT_336788 [Ascobolus immersus RN42]|uniref:CCHC-type domain-containing protein n=1 Tax=Ascobolus immersus RN42 TaxID=1160509 RepID=A0A3N4HM96_ASCIM|nr:hypothetical protein BJ508DRAFT_336788 [Ascobolus immersus RN42]
MDPNVNASLQHITLTNGGMNLATLMLYTSRLFAAKPQLVKSQKDTKPAHLRGKAKIQKVVINNVEVEEEGDDDNDTTVNTVTTDKTTTNSSNNNRGRGGMRGGRGRGRGGSYNKGGVNFNSNASSSGSQDNFYQRACYLCNETDHILGECPLKQQLLECIKKQQEKKTGNE